MPYCKVEIGSNMSKIINLASTGTRISAELANKTRKYGLFAKFSSAVIGAWDVAKNPEIFLTRSN